MICLDLDVDESLLFFFTLPTELIDSSRHLFDLAD